MCHPLYDTIIKICKKKIRQRDKIIITKSYKIAYIDEF